MALLLLLLLVVGGAADPVSGSSLTAALIAVMSNGVNHYLPALLLTCITGSGSTRKMTRVRFGCLVESCCLPIKSTCRSTAPLLRLHCCASVVAAYHDFDSTVMLARSYLSIPRMLEVSCDPK